MDCLVGTIVIDDKFIFFLYGKTNKLGETMQDNIIVVENCMIELAKTPEGSCGGITIKDGKVTPVVIPPTQEQIDIAKKLLSEFIIDAKLGKAHTWEIYKQELGRIKDNHCKNRWNKPEHFKQPTPFMASCEIKMSPLSKSEVTRCNLNKNHTSIGILHDLTRFKSAMDKVKYLMELNLPTDVLKDYLTMIKADTERAKKRIVLRK